MRALLLAAGLGSRLSPLTDVIQKCMAPINGRPLLEYWLVSLSESNIDSILINVHHCSEMVRDYLNGVNLPLKIEVVHENELLGTGGTLKKNKTFFDEEPIILIHADNLCGCDTNKFIQRHKARPANTEMTMMTFTTPTPQLCGIVETDGLGIVQAFHEKVQNPPGNLANAAVYILEPSVFDFLEGFNRRFIDFSVDVLPHYIGKISTFYNSVYHRDIGNIESLMKAQIDYIDHLGASCPIISKQNKSFKVSIKLAQDILERISILLNADLVPLFPQKECVLLKRGNIPFQQQGENVCLVADSFTPDAYEQILNVVEEFQGKNIMIVFYSVKKGFSSYEFYQQTGLPAFAIYSH